MQQRIIWMLVLAFGILISFYSCNKTTVVDKSFYEEFKYSNNSEHDLLIKTFNIVDNEYISNTYSLPIQSDFSQEINLMFGSKIGIIALCDSVVVDFGEDKISYFLPETESSFNIVTHKNYNCIEKDENHRACSYNFTNEDYDNANEQ